MILTTWYMEAEIILHRLPGMDHLSEIIYTDQIYHIAYIISEKWLRGWLYTSPYAHEKIGRNLHICVYHSCRQYAHKLVFMATIPYVCSLFLCHENKKRLMHSFFGVYFDPTNVLQQIKWTFLDMETKSIQLNRHKVNPSKTLTKKNNICDTQYK